ncbi:hypothetical protein KDL45_05425, partial [bacterium]|nr:hypothetical protein [bacterium]
ACPLSEEAPSEGPVNPLIRAIFRFLYRSRLGNALFPFRSLTHFKSKFADHWDPVYMGGWPTMGPWALYLGCRLWGLFG